MSLESEEDVSGGKPRGLARKQPFPYSHYSIDFDDVGLSGSEHVFFKN